MRKVLAVTDAFSRRDVGPDEESPRRATNWNLVARNFAVSLVQRLELALSDMQVVCVGDYSPFGFVLLMSDFISRIPGAVSSRETCSSPRRAYGVLECTAGLSSEARHAICKKASNDAFLSSSDGAVLHEQIKRWETYMRHRWDKILEGDDDSTVDPFASEAELEFSLWHLFKAIDHNGSRRVNWETFLAYLFDSVLKGRAGTSSQEDIRTYTLVDREVSPLLQRVRCMALDAKNGTVLVHSKEKEGHVLRLMEDRCLATLREKEYRVPVEHGALISYELIPSMDCVAVSTADAFVRIIELKTHHVRLRRKATVSVTKLRWNERHKRLYCGMRTGELQIWSLFVERSFDYEKRHIPEPTIVRAAEVHSDAITDLLFLPFDGHLVTASLDSRIKCLHSTSLKQVRVLLGHRKGVKHLAYSQQHNLLISAGHEYNPLCWVTNVPTSKHFQLRDGNKPHASSISGIMVVPLTPQCVSLDLSGMVKIWDIRTMQCVQSLQCEPNCSKEEMRLLHFHAFVFHSEQRRIVIAANRTTYVLKYNVQGRSTNPTTAMDYGICDTHFCEKQFFVFTCSRRDLRAWDLRTGMAVLSSDHVVKDDITCIEADEEGRKGYVGCFDGSICVVSMSTGIVSATATLPCACEISYLAAIPDTPYIVCCAQDGTLAVVSDVDSNLDVNKFVVASSGKRSTRLDVKVIVLYQEYNVLLLGCGENTVSVFKLSPIVMSGQPPQWVKEGECTGSPSTSEVTCLTPLHGYPCFAAADSSGGVHIYTLKGDHVKQPYTMASRWVNNMPEGCGYTPTVVQLGFVHDFNFLYTADEMGIVNIYNVHDGLRFGLNNMSPEAEKPVVSPFHQWLKADRRQAAPASVFIHSWHAHDDGITSLRIIEKKNTIMTSGGDCLVTFWTLWGVKVGNLSKSKPSGYFSLKSCEEGCDVPWPHNPLARKTSSMEKLAGVAWAFRKQTEMTTVKHILCSSDLWSTEENDASGQQTEAEVLQSINNLPDAEDQPCATLQTSVVDESEKAYDFAKLRRYFMVFFKTKKQIMTWMRDPDCSEGDIETPEPSPTKDDHRHHFTSYLIARSPPTAAQVAEGCLKNRDAGITLPPVIQPREATPSVPEAVLSANTRYETGATTRDLLNRSLVDWNSFMDSSHKSAVVLQKSTHKVVPQRAKSTRVANLSGSISAVGLRPFRAVPGMFVRKGAAPEATTHRGHTVAQTKLRPLKQTKRVPHQKTFAPSNAYFEATSDMEWNTSGDCIATRKLWGNGAPRPKSWLVT